MFVIRQVQRLESAVETSERERQAAERKVGQLSQRLSSAHSELADERQLGAALRANQQEWQQRLSALQDKHQQLRQDRETEVTELKEQIRDLMFYIDAGRAINESTDKDDIAGGTVTVAPAPQAKRRGRKKR